MVVNQNTLNKHIVYDLRLTYLHNQSITNGSLNNRYYSLTSHSCGYT